MIVQVILLILGFVILIKGADWLVFGGAALARKYKVSELGIGLTIVAFGTSMPELVVNAFASYQSNSELVYGNVIGSNNFNLFVILGIAGLISPLVVQSSTVWREIPLSFAAALLLFVLSNSVFSGDEILTRVDGVILLTCFCLFLFYVFGQLKREELPVEAGRKESSNFKVWFLILVGLVALIAGGQLVVTNAVVIAQTLGISQTIIGLTIVAAGTSLPELATSVVAATKGKNDIAIGNIIGSNIFNIFLILGVSALIRPVSYNVAFNLDMILLGIGTLLLFFAMFSGARKKLDRWEAGLLLTIYIGYVVFLISGEVQ